MADPKNSVLRQAICFSKYNIQRAFSRPKQYVILFAVSFLLMWSSTFTRTWLEVVGPEYSNSTLDFTVLNVMEPFIFLSNSYWMYFYIMIGLVFLLSDCPFEPKGAGYYLLRSNRHSWFLGQVFYIVFLAFVYNAILFIVSVFCLIPHIALNNHWSLIIARAGMFETMFGIELAFSDNLGKLGLLSKSMSPITFGIITFVFNLLWMSALGCFTTALALFSKSKLGFMAVGTWITLYNNIENMNYTFINLLHRIDFVYLSQFVNRWYDGRRSDAFSMYIHRIDERYSVGFFLILFIISCAIGLHWAKKYDFSKI